MTSIDERIKQELEREGATLDGMLTDEGLPKMIESAFRGSMRRWMWFVAIVAIALLALTVWLIVGFVGAASLDDRVFWGVWSVLSAMTMLAFEMWAWMQISRIATLREIHALELRIKFMAGDK